MDLYLFLVDMLLPWTVFVQLQEAEVHATHYTGLQTPVRGMKLVKVICIVFIAKLQDKLAIAIYPSNILDDGCTLG